MKVVLDTSAVLATLWGEPGAERVDALIDSALISSVNLAELVAKLVDRGATPDHIADVLAALDLETADFDESQSGISGEFRRVTREAGLSLGDRCCLALGQSRELPVLTADRAWSQLDIGVEVEVIR